MLGLKSIFQPWCRSDVHGLHPHGAAGQEAEPEQSREGARAGEGHGQHRRPERPRPQEEREEVLLRRPMHRRAETGWGSPRRHALREQICR